MLKRAGSIVSVVVLLMCFWMIVEICVAEKQQVYIPDQGNIILNCSLSDLPYVSMDSNITMFWIFIYQNMSSVSILDGLEINPKAKYMKYNPTGNLSIGQYNLEVNQVSRTDEGLYRCGTIVENGTLKTTEYDLKLIVIPSNLSIPSLTQMGTIVWKEDVSLDINCYVTSGIPKEVIQWKNDTSTLSRGGPGQLEYTFTPRREDNGKKLVCEVQQKFLNAPLSTTVSLDILYKPVVSITASKTIIIEGNRLTLHCSSDSNPETKITTIAKGEKLAKTCTTKKCAYSLNINRQDKGIYSCKATNQEGYSISETEILVFYPPNVTVSCTDTSLKCVPNGLPMNFSFISWEHLSESRTLIRTINSSDSFNLLEYGYIERYKFTGFYKCTVSNGVPDSKGNLDQSGELFLKLQDRPRIMIQTKTTQYGKFGTSGQLSLLVYSYPEPIKVDVYRNGSELRNANIIITNETQIDYHAFGKLIQLTGSTVNLFLQLLDESSFTLYEFYVWNRIGYDQLKINLTPKDISVENYMYQSRASLPRNTEMTSNQRHISFQHSGNNVCFGNIRTAYSQQDQSALNYAEVIFDESSDVELENQGRDVTIYSEIDHTVLAPRHLDESIGEIDPSPTSDDDDNDNNDFM